ncbi:glycine betaine ABC transporter substrate-binding protein [Phaeobacter gallaeciensis]|uniref:ABC-type proline/glycine betaine transport system, periplasmic component n=1 Tax=Phaeobacter gallaeciensis TaxID=60890 RepID=A0AAD0EEY4_9RHOB|nr:glycine betaine ABC transporter substrate-binding protein [Phaeobacter gallaeciensis]AHD11909.1 ABC-type proline/glycine betaine transport system, periplasmic component [Phaeobacter gallaeciensis DSM 26640]ATE95175.1 ABC-type proline/glycine betaine transport system, periplasmic component [Phaeobacter gallaeciensis]ATE99483.1 ABC-type proline/glycine betaine transport system, periplasmic component [Phaeobacter gallaeciensis]ATF03880.1 ABC-type proline/glycine betaine transport system, peripl
MSKPLVVGQIALSFHKAAAAVLCELLTRTGHVIEVKEAPHEDMYAMQKAGDVDLVVSAWLPASHGTYIEPYADELQKLSVMYHPYCIWGISDRAPETIRSVSDLAKPQVAALFRKRIQGIGSGAGISRFSRRMVRDYQLDAQGFHFENGTLEDCTSAYLETETEGDLAIVPLWHPQWLNSQSNLRELEDPLGLLGGQDEATLVLRRDAAHKLNSQGRALLERIQLGNDLVSQLDREICCNGKTPREAALAWIDANHAQWKAWSTPDIQTTLQKS